MDSASVASSPHFRKPVTVMDRPEQEQESLRGYGVQACKEPRHYITKSNFDALAGRFPISVTFSYGTVAMK